MRKTVQIKKELTNEFPNIVFSQIHYQIIQGFLENLLTWNNKMNLTSIADPFYAFGKHILDSLVFLKIFHQTIEGKGLDIGSGSGLPGFMLAMMNPNLEIISVDKVKKKIIFQQIQQSEFNLHNFNPLHLRIEDLKKSNYFEQYNWLFSRAFQPISSLLELGNYFLKSGGNILLWKGQQWEKEYIDTSSILKKNMLLIQKYRYEFSEFNVGGWLLWFQKQ